LWFKEVNFDQRHLIKGFLTEIDVAIICQENLKPVQISRFLKNKLLLEWHKSEQSLETVKNEETFNWHPPEINMWVGKRIELRRYTGLT